MTATSQTQSLHECPICLTEDDQDSFVQAVHRDAAINSHIFHRSCLDQWLRSRSDCPLCRRTVVRVEIAPPCTSPQEPADGAPTSTSITSIRQRHPFWTHRKAFSMACIVSGLTLWFTTSAIKSDRSATLPEPSLSTLALKFTKNCIAEHPKKSAAALASLTMTPEILRILKICLWDQKTIRTIVLSSIGTIAIIINIGLPVK